MSDSPSPCVLCFGEILWDFLPAGLFPGGAPFNVAYHLHQLGLDARVVSAVGQDVLGAELLRRLAQWGVSTGLIAQRAPQPTGYVRAEIGASGDAHYDIVRDVAWDAIPASATALAQAAHASAFIFGSLAARSPENRVSLARLIAALPAAALRVFDVNLRAPFDDLERVRELARHASILKLNADEAARLAGAPPAEPSPSALEAHARRLAGEFGISLVVVTAAAHGAGLLRDGRWSWENGQPVQVADTIGAGDAFLARFVAGLLRGERDDARVLAHACRLGEWVATQRGATPAYTAATPR